MAVIGYIRVSTEKQDYDTQKLAILDYCQKNKLAVDKWQEIKVSSRKSTKRRRIDELLDLLKPNDVLIVSELSRLARSVGQIAIIVDQLIEKNVFLTTIKEDININGQMNIQTKTITTMFSLYGEIERDLISERTKEGLKAARSKGKILGRPKGGSILDGKEDFILTELDYGVAVSAITRKLNCSRGTLIRFIEVKRLKSQR
ncbi:recombinase family protein [bacterium]|nr:recombinase family protein [bacterium]